MSIIKPSPISNRGLFNDVFHEILSYLDDYDIYFIKNNNILRRKIDINQWCNTTALKHKADTYAIRGYLEIVQFLYNSGIKITEEGFCSTVRCNMIEIINFILISSKVNLNRIKLHNLIINASGLGYCEMVKKLIYYYYTKTCIPIEISIFHQVTKNGHLDLVKYLIDKIDLTKCSIPCIFDCCKRKGHTEILDYLTDITGNNVYCNNMWVRKYSTYKQYRNT